jgi:hypothetical protein
MPGGLAAGAAVAGGEEEKVVRLMDMSRFSIRSGL